MRTSDLLRAGTAIAPPILLSPEQVALPLMQSRRRAASHMVASHAGTQHAQQTEASENC